MIQQAIQVLAWGIAQVVTLVAPELVIVGGGVSLIGEQQFFSPLRQWVDQYIFPPLDGSFKIVPASLGQWVVVHGAIRLASEEYGNIDD